MRTEEEARRRGGELLEKLLPIMPTAKLRVHENLGWFATVATDHISVGFGFMADWREKTRYNCLISDTVRAGSGRGDWTTHDNPYPFCPIKTVLYEVEQVNKHCDWIANTRIAINMEVI
jgi:hypothetical protein